MAGHLVDGFAGPCDPVGRKEPRLAKAPHLRTDAAKTLPHLLPIAFGGLEFAAAQAAASIRTTACMRRPSPGRRPVARCVETVVNKPEATSRAASRQRLRGCCSRFMVLDFGDEKRGQPYPPVRPCIRKDERKMQTRLQFCPDEVSKAKPRCENSPTASALVPTASAVSERTGEERPPAGDTAGPTPKEKRNKIMFFPKRFCDMSIFC